MDAFENTVLKSISSAIVRYADRNAFCIRDQFYTYYQFGQCIERIRKTLRQVSFHSPYPGLMVNDDIETYASIFALWFEHLAYVPISTEWPEDRQQSVIRQTGMEIVLDSGSPVHTNAGGVGESDETDSAVSSDCAGIIFTSGSTGKPKGVLISRQNVLSLFETLSDLPFQTTADDRILLYYDLTFIAALRNILAALSQGACCFTIPKKVIKYLYVSELLEKYRITQLSVPVSVLRLLHPYYEEMDSSSLKYCIVGTEACTEDVVRDWMKFAPQAPLYNYYGSTECMGVYMYYPASSDKIKSINGYLSIGQAVLSVVALILDEDGNEVPSGQKGELCVSGENVTPGYWQDEKSNRDSFFEKEYQGRNCRFFRTGDLCFKDKDGDVMNCGRVNQMCKINGMRVEMSEIEFHASTYLDGVKVVCMPFEPASGMTQICLFAEAAPLDEKSLLAYLRTKLPAYMIPARIISVPEMPLTVSGKTDRQALLMCIKK